MRVESGKPRKKHTKLTEELIQQLVVDYIAGLGQAALALKYGVTQATISRLLRRK